MNDMKRRIMVIMVLISSVMILKYFWNFDEPMFQTITYLFDGENEMFSITDGQIVISEKKDVFYCGHLKLKDGIANDISAYQTSYYIQMNDENHIITIDQKISEDSHINIEIDDDLGKVSGKDYIIVDKNEDIDSIIRRIQFKVKIKKIDGTIKTMDIPLSIKKVIK